MLGCGDEFPGTDQSLAQVPHTEGINLKPREVGCWEDADETPLVPHLPKASPEPEEFHILGSGSQTFCAELNDTN